MPGHADSLNKLYEALLAGTTGCKQAFGENHLWSVFAKPEVSGSQKHSHFFLTDNHGLVVF
jgi:hypothetical protein